jgi:hypothetical protein
VQAITWKDKIADSSNLWLNATRSEEDGKLAEATVFYLRDAAYCLGRQLAARAALSCSCAASCLEKEGNINAARNLYFEAAKIYEEQAAVAFGTSIREALWLLQQAHDHFIVGGDAQKAAQVYDRCASLARKLSPFISGENLDEVLGISRRTEATQASSSVPTPQTSEIDDEIEGFLRLRDAQASKATPQVQKSASGTRRRPSVEKSVVS